MAAVASHLWVGQRDGDLVGMMVDAAAADRRRGFAAADAAVPVARVGPIVRAAPNAEWCACLVAGRVPPRGSGHAMRRARGARSVAVRKWLILYARSI